MESEKIGIDLHCHTKISDGSTGIDELVLLAKKQGVLTISVTDHDTFAGSTRAKIFGDRNGVEVIPGVEFSAYDYSRKRKVHILCYYCHCPDRLEGLCKQIGDSRRHATNLMIHKVLHLYNIPVEMIQRRAQGSINIYKQHIMHALIDAGFADSIFGSVFQRLFSPRGGLAYCPMEYPDVHEVLARLHEAGGVAVLAHPAQYDSFDLLLELATNKELDGVEVWHPSASDTDIAALLDLAAKHDLVTTGGTDFHGMYSNLIHPIGTYTVTADQFNQLKKKKKLLQSSS